MNCRNLAGRRFGRLTVTEDSGERKNGYILWRCKCDCGNEILAVTNKLTAGVLTDCGCSGEKKSGPRAAEDLTGRKFGELTVLRRVENKGSHTQWLCRCSCGKLHKALAFKLKQGKVKSCGCKQYDWFGGINLAGRRFDRLVALYPVKVKHKGSSAMWHCKCDCGNEVDAPAYGLLNGMIHSCGCLTKEHGSQLHTHLHNLENTCVEGLIRAQKNFRNNTAGFRGLCLTKSGSYRVTINFQKKHYLIGTFKTFEEAVEARLDAEESLHAGFVDAYSRWKKKAEADPSWGESNPFYYEVERSDRKFIVSTNA